MNALDNGLLTPESQRKNIDRYRKSLEERGIVTLRATIPEEFEVEFRLKALELRNAHRKKRGEPELDLAERMAKYKATAYDGMVSVRVYVPHADKPSLKKWAESKREEFRRNRPSDTKI